MLMVRDLRSCYGRVEVLHGVSLRVKDGEIVALVGSNGAGKTTLLGAISGVQQLAAGQITLNNESITRMPAHRRVRLGLVHVPESRQVFTPLTVEENLKVGAWTRKDSPSDDIEFVFTMFPILAEYRHRPAGMLSGGQQQMLAIGRALMSRPRMLLLDEPSMGLAPRLIEQIFSIVSDIRKQGVTILVVEQNLQAALAIADRAYVIENGAVSLEGSSEDLLDDPRVLESYLGLQQKGA